MTGIDWFIVLYFAAWALMAAVVWFFTTIAGAMMEMDSPFLSEWSRSTKAWVLGTVLMIQTLALGAFTVGMLVGRQ